MATPLPIANGFYISDSLPISAQECTNWRPNIVQTAGLSQETLFGTEGLLQLQTTGTNKQINRGMHVKNGIPYFVNGTSLISLTRTVDSEGVETFGTTIHGTIPGTARVSMADNGTQLMILVPGGSGFIFDEDAGTPFQTITDAGFTANGAPQYVVYIDGFFVASTDTKKFINSAINDGLSWNALDRGTAEVDPDIIVAPHVHSNQLFIAGSETFQVFENVARTVEPFQTVRGFIIPKGLFAPLAIIEANNTFMWLGGGVNESPAIWQFNGGSNPIKISNTAVDAALDKFTNEEIDAAFAYSYAKRGAYIIGFTVGNRTFEYNTITQRWNERKSQIDDSPTRWRANSLGTAYNRVLVGDSVDGRIGEVDPDTFTEYGTNIIRIVTTQPFSNNGDSLKVPLLELTVESGVGNSDVPDPKISMARSLDGKKFLYEQTRSTGKIGEFNRRAQWRRQGRFARFEVLRFRMSDAVKPVIIKLEAKTK